MKLTTSEGGTHLDTRYRIPPDFMSASLDGQLTLDKPGHNGKSTYE